MNISERENRYKALERLEDLLDVDTSMGDIRKIRNYLVEKLDKRFAVYGEEDGRKVSVYPQIWHKVYYDNNVNYNSLAEIVLKRSIDISKLPYEYPNDKELSNKVEYFRIFFDVMNEYVLPWMTFWCMEYKRGLHAFPNINKDELKKFEGQFVIKDDEDAYKFFCDMANLYLEETNKEFKQYLTQEDSLKL